MAATICIVSSTYFLMKDTSTSVMPLVVPLYVRVKQEMLDALARGEWKQGDMVPPEKTLAERFDVSIGTLRKAIDELAAENILVRQQGRGTFVAMHTRNPQFFKFFRILRQDGVQAYPTTQLLRFQRARATGVVRERLGLPVGAYVLEFSQVLSLNGDVVTVDDICLPEAWFPGLAEHHLRNRLSTLYALYQDEFGVNVIATDERVRVCQADEIHARWLGVADHTPLLEIRRVAYSYNRVPVEWRVSRVNTANYEYLGHESGNMLGG